MGSLIPFTKSLLLPSNPEVTPQGPQLQRNSYINHTAQSEQDQILEMVWTASTGLWATHKIHIVNARLVLPHTRPCSVCVSVSFLYPHSSAESCIPLLLHLLVGWGHWGPANEVITPESQLIIGLEAIWLSAASSGRSPLEEWLHRSVATENPKLLLGMRYSTILTSLLCFILPSPSTSVFLRNRFHIPLTLPRLSRAFGMHHCLLVQRKVKNFKGPTCVKWGGSCDRLQWEPKYTFLPSPQNSSSLSRTCKKHIWAFPDRSHVQLVHRFLNQKPSRSLAFLIPLGRASWGHFTVSTRSEGRRDPREQTQCCSHSYPVLRVGDALISYLLWDCLEGT